MPEHQQPSNILDLRQVMAERQAAAEHPKRAPRRSSPLHRPSRPPRDWLSLGRETVKFLMATIVVVLVLWGGQMLWHAWQTVQAAAAQGKIGAQALQLGGRAISADQPVQAEKLFQQATAAFTESNRLLQHLNTSSGHLVQHLPWIAPRWRAATNLVAAGTNFAEAGTTLSQILPPDIGSQPAVTITTKGIVQGSVGLLQPLLQHRTKFLAAVDQGLDAVDQLGQVNSHNIPGSLRQEFASWDKFRPLISGPSGRLRPLVNMLLGLMASPEPKDELVIFENNDELRATGGFAGTYLLIEFNQGGFQILDSPGNGPYALTQQIPKTILPPQPLLAINPYWAFQDTNWFLDVPTSASFTLDFYKQARGFRPDGVIYITPQLMEDLLTITGPIRPEHYQVDITADNFVRATEQQVEFGYDKALNNPKQFLIDLVPTMIQKIAALPGPKAAQAGLTLLDAADHQNLMLVSEDASVEKDIVQLGWDGGLIKPDDDGLAVVDTNLGGGKTDRVIDETVKVDVQDTGSELRHTVTVTRKHNGQVGNTLTGFTNKDFIRVYAPTDAQFVSVSGETVPSGNFFFSPPPGAAAPAKLLSTEGQVLIDPQTLSRITHENGRLVMGAWSTIAVGATQSVTFTYDTPRSTTNSWSLLWQHQPGAPTRQWQVTYHAASGRHITSTTGGKVSHQNVTWTTTSDTNQVFGVLF